MRNSRRRNKVKARATDDVLFLYGKIGKKNKAVIYCSLHKCYLSKPQLFSKNFKCEKCKHMKDIEEE